MRPSKNSIKNYKLIFKRNSKNSYSNIRKSSLKRKRSLTSLKVRLMNSKLKIRCSRERRNWKENDIISYKLTYSLALSAKNTKKSCLNSLLRGRSFRENSSFLIHNWILRINVNTKPLVPKIYNWLQKNPLIIIRNISHSKQLHFLYFPIVNLLNKEN